MFKICSQQCKNVRIQVSSDEFCGKMSYENKVKTFTSTFAKRLVSIMLQKFNLSFRGD